MNLWLISLLVLLGACGGDNNDTIFTGFSGVLIFGIIAWIVYRVVKNRS